MGDLIKEAGYSEITKMVEILDHHGVTPHDLEVLRKASSWSQSVVGRIHKTDSFLWAMLEMEHAAAKAGFNENDFRRLAQDEDLCKRVLELIRDQDGTIGAVGTIVSTETKWTTDAEGNIRFTVMSNGMTREQWEQHLERRGWRIGDWARNALRRASEAPTSGVPYSIVVRPGKKIKDNDRITKKIRAHAAKQGWKTPHWEVSCLIRDAFTDEQLEQMGLWYIVTMHEPIEDSGGDPCLLCAYRGGAGRWLGASYVRPGGDWNDCGGFAFVVQQESSASVPQT